MMLIVAALPILAILAHIAATSTVYETRTQARITLLCGIAISLALTV